MCVPSGAHVGSRLTTGGVNEATVAVGVQPLIEKSEAPVNGSTTTHAMLWPSGDHSGSTFVALGSPKDGPPRKSLPSGRTVEIVVWSPVTGLQTKAIHSPLALQCGSDARKGSPGPGTGVIACAPLPSAFATQMAPRAAYASLPSGDQVGLSAPWSSAVT